MDKDLNRIKVVLMKKHLISKWFAENQEKSSRTVSKWCSQKLQADLQIMKIVNLFDTKLSELNVD